MEYRHVPLFSAHPVARLVKSYVSYQRPTCPVLGSRRVEEWDESENGLERAVVDETLSCQVPLPRRPCNLLHYPTAMELHRLPRLFPLADQVGEHAGAVV